MQSVSTRTKVLDAAALLFVQRDYKGVAMDEVRRTAGVSNGSLYHHFPTKAELAEALYIEILRDFHAALMQVIENDVVAEAGVRGLVRAHIQWVVKNPHRALLLHKLRRDGEISDASEGITKANAQAFGALRTWIRQKTEAGCMRAMPFHLWMALVFAPTMSLIPRWLSLSECMRTNEPAALARAAWLAVSS